MYIQTGVNIKVMFCSCNTNLHPPSHSHDLTIFLFVSMFCIQHSAAAVTADTFRHRWHVMTDLKAFIYLLYLNTYTTKAVTQDSTMWYVNNSWIDISTADCCNALLQITREQKFKAIYWKFIHHLVFTCLHLCAAPDNTALSAWIHIKTGELLTGLSWNLTFQKLMEIYTAVLI